MKFDFSNGAMKAIGKLDTKMAGRIFKGIMGLPEKGDIKPLVGYTNGSKRLQIGQYRIIFREIDKLIYISEIGSRGDIYK